MKITDLSLPELYEKKATPSVLKRIRELEDFSVMQANYCGICPMEKKATSPEYPWNQGESGEVLVILPHLYVDEVRGDYVSSRGRDRTYRIQALIKGMLNYAPSISFLPAYGCAQQRYTAVPMKGVRHCSSYLKNRISLRPPKIILACGPNSVTALGLKASRGDITSYAGIPVVVSYDPRIFFMIRQNASGDMWGPDYLAVLKRDMKKLDHLYNGGTIPTLPEALEEAAQKIEVVTTLEQVSEMVSTLSEESWISFDIETSGLDPWSPDAKILMAQFGTKEGDRAWVVTLWHREWNEYDADEAWEMIAPLLVSERVVKVGHNIKFDCLYTQVVKHLRVLPVEDTLLSLHSLHSGTQGEYGLKTSVRDLLFKTGLGGYEDGLTSS